MLSQKPARKSDEIVVFSIVRDSACAECHSELWRGQFLRMENERPLCMSCADLDRLVFLPSGDAALTRRASKYSRLRAVVVRFSRTRKRYERQGVLVDETALGRAEEECLADREARERARERAAEKRAQLDADYVLRFFRAIGELYPNAPEPEKQAIARHACAIYSGRVGRSAAAKQLEPSAIELAVRAHVRHEHTRYDELLAQGYDRRTARAEVAARVEEVLRLWRRPAGQE
jgi:hypothetical protein